MKPKILKHPSYTYRKDGVYYFVRNIPKDLAKHYSKSKFVKSLRTKSKRRAVTASQVLSAKLDDQWFKLRLVDDSDPLMAIKVSEGAIACRFGFTLSDALAQYLETKGLDKGVLSHRTAVRNCDYLKLAIGEKGIEQYTTKDAANFREFLARKGLSGASIHRIFGNIKAIFNFCILENGLDVANPFSGTYLPSSRPLETRRAFNQSDLLKLNQLCVNKNDDIRWLISLIADTGMRLSEAVGLEVVDLRLDEEIPFVDLKPNRHRGLKTLQSVRCIPLVGASLWAANNLRSKHVSGVCFPRYFSTGKLSSNSASASASLNKWIKSIFDENYVVHGLRHTFRDRLRNVGAPADLIDQIGGWSSSSVGQSYGDGYSFEVASILNSSGYRFLLIFTSLIVILYD